jgi:hypothetical protein
MPSRRVWLPRAGGRRAGRGGRAGLGSAGLSLVMVAERAWPGFRSGHFAAAVADAGPGWGLALALGGDGRGSTVIPAACLRPTGEGFVGSRSEPGNIDRGFGP